MKAPSPSPLPPGWWQRVRHDLRSAVAPMRMAVQLLRAGKVDEADRKEALQVIDRQIEFLLSDIEDIGELMRIQSGSFALEATDQDANLLLDIVCGRGALTRDLAARRVTLRCDPCEAEALVGHDPARLAALLEFLLMRAAAHSPPETELVLALRQDEGVSLHLSGAEPSLAGDAELQHLLEDSAGAEPPSLRALLMRQILRSGGIGLRQDGEGAVSLHFAGAEEA